MVYHTGSLGASPKSGLYVVMITGDTASMDGQAHSMSAGNIDS